ncbi:MAG: hypothetical protein QOF57_664 [Frankiaceae bacterium]|jgi:hypothetical protein|nr:hypothetical protein [Frankiaceae bacterium]
MAWSGGRFLLVTYVCCIVVAAIYAYSDNSGLTTIPLWGIALPSSLIYLTGMIASSAARPVLISLCIAQWAALLMLVRYREMRHNASDESREN